MYYVMPTNNAPSRGISFKLRSAVRHSSCQINFSKILPSVHSPRTCFLHACLPGLSSRLPNTTLTSTQPPNSFGSSSPYLTALVGSSSRTMSTMSPDFYQFVHLYAYWSTYLSIPPCRSTPVAQKSFSSMQERTLRQRMSRFTHLTPSRSTCYHYSISVHSTQRQLPKL